MRFSELSYTPHWYVRNFCIHLNRTPQCHNHWPKRCRFKKEISLRRTVFIAFLLLALLAPAAAQSAPKPDWSPWNWLIGTWDSKTVGKPGTSVGSFSLLYSLDHAVLVRKSIPPNHAAKAKPASHHQDFMVIYEENDKWRADYWDTERHVIHYGITIEGGNATFLSDAKPGAPTHRLTYKRLDKGALGIEFAIAAPGSEKFKTYASGVCERRPGS